MSKSAHILQITRDVALSKNFPLPSVTFEGGHDLTNLFIHLDPFIRFRDCNNSTDFMNGFAITLNGPTIVTSKSTATVENKIATGIGTTDEEIITVYNAKHSHIVTAPINMDIMGCRNTELCKSVSICNVRYVFRHTKRRLIPLLKSLQNILSATYYTFWFTKNVTCSLTREELTSPRLDKLGLLRHQKDRLTRFQLPDTITGELPIS